MNISIKYKMSEAYHVHGASYSWDGVAPLDGMSYQWGHYNYQGRSGEGYYISVQEKYRRDLEKDEQDAYYSNAYFSSITWLPMGGN